MCRRRKTDTHPSMAWPGSGPNEWFQCYGSDTGSAASALCFIATKKPAAAPRSWEHKLRQRLWNGTGGVYDAFLIDVHLKKREWNASIQLGDAPSRPSSPSCHRQRGSQAGRQAAQSCNWAAVKGAGNVRFLGPNCHFVCKFELWKCWAWKWEIAANNCWIRPCSQSCCRCVVSLACNLAKIYMYVCILWAMQEITESSGICWVNDACQPLPRLVARLQLLPQHTPTLIHATSVATLAPPRDDRNALLTNARPIVAHPLTVDQLSLSVARQLIH